MGRTLDVVVDIAVIGLAAVLTLLVGGRVLNSSTAHRLDSVPIAGQLITGVRAAWDELYRAPAA